VKAEILFLFIAHHGDVDFGLSHIASDLNVCHGDILDPRISQFR
jgi:hypothetical protein